MMMRKLLSGILGFICCITLSAQDFRYSAKIDSVAQKAYYKIVLSPELLGKLNKHQTDVRLYNENKAEQPYFMQSEKSSSAKSSFIEYKVIDKMLEKDTLSYLIFHNPNKTEINNVSVVVKNTDVQKRARLSGSDDQKSWYVIKEDYLLHAMKSREETMEFKILHFPLSDYEFFKLELNDWERLPINILKVGYYDTEKQKGLSTEFDCPILEQKDSANTSYIKVSLSDHRYVEKLKIELSGAEFFDRTVKIFIKKEHINHKKKTTIINEEIARFNVNSNSLNEFTIAPQPLKNIYFEIENRDNPPLIFDKVTASYLNKYLVAELFPIHSYQLKFGNNELGAPDYDIEKFSEVVEVSSQKVLHQKVEALTLKSEKEKASSIFDSKLFVWSVIAIVGLILGIISFKMIRELGERKP